VSLLTHPLGHLSPVVADVSLRSGIPGSLAGWPGERILWSGRNLPYVVTYSKVWGQSTEGSSACC
jgi:hypothetical protein